MTPAQMRATEWSYLAVNNQLVSHICPTCAAQIPPGNDYADVSFRERHIRWHESVHPVQTKHQS